MCTEYNKHKGKLPASVRKDVEKAMQHVEKVMAMKFGDPGQPAPGVLPIGRAQVDARDDGDRAQHRTHLEDHPRTHRQDQNPRFVFDAYRRLMQMYSDVVMEKAAGIEPAEGQGVRQQLEREMNKIKDAKGYKADTDLTVEDLQTLAETYKAKIQEVLGKPFPDDPWEQLWAASRPCSARERPARHQLPPHRGHPGPVGTAVNVQAMVFGNMGNTSATGVAFTRNPATGENKFYGEWLPNAQGEDVVAASARPIR